MKLSAEIISTIKFLIMMATISLILFLILSLEKKILGIVKKDQVSLVGGNVPMHLTTKEFLLVRPA